MKLFFRSLFKIFLIFTILFGCSTTEETKETDSIAHLNQGTFFVKKGQYDQGIVCFNKAIAINPKLAMAYNNRGFAFYEKGQYDKAISDFNKAIKISPWFAEAYNNRGLALFYIREYEKSWDDSINYKIWDIKFTQNFLRLFVKPQGYSLSRSICY